MSRKEGHSRRMWDSVPMLEFSGGEARPHEEGGGKQKGQNLSVNGISWYFCKLVVFGPYLPVEGMWLFCERILIRDETSVALESKVMYG